MSEKTEELWPTNVKTFKKDGEYYTYLTPENQKVFDDLFTDFIATFGTHYIRSAKMGAIMRIEEEMVSLDSSNAKEGNVTKCLEEKINKKHSITSSRLKDSENCANEGINRMVESALKTSKEELLTFGSGSNKDIHAWTNGDFPHPTLLPDFKLQPILKLFTEEFMNVKR